MRTTIALLAASLFLLAPLAGATEHDGPNETKADCEEGQPWIGYGRTDGARSTAENTTAEDADVRTCEGEHWDGQDNVQGQPENDPADQDGPVCLTNDAGGVDNFHVGNCMYSDPNTGGSDMLEKTDPFNFRVSGTTDGREELFVAIDIAQVGRAAVYVGHCSGGEESPGLEGAEKCEGSDQFRTGTYVRDNTPNNVLATIVSAPRLTQGYVSEADCTQAVYQHGAYHPPSDCGRDNTAISTELILP